MGKALPFPEGRERFLGLLGNGRRELESKKIAREYGGSFKVKWKIEF